MTENLNFLGPSASNATSTTNTTNKQDNNATLCSNTKKPNTAAEVIATTKEEEWISKKKTELTNTKQIETRIKRQIKLEDGKIIEDSGSTITSNIIEDTEKQEQHETELRKLDNDDANEIIKSKLNENETWLVIPKSYGIVKEVKDINCFIRQEKLETKETEDSQNLGDFSDKDYLSAVQTLDKTNLCKILKKSKQAKTKGPNIIKKNTTNKTVLDTENITQQNSIQNGKLITEIEKITEHEEIKQEELPEDSPDQNCYSENSERCFKTLEKHNICHLLNGKKINEEMYLKAETMELEKSNNGLDETDFESFSTRMRKKKEEDKEKLNKNYYRTLPYLENNFRIDSRREDVITRKPINFNREEETRKNETSKWLEYHFGSDSKSSNNSFSDEEEEKPPKTNFFNVSIKSQPITINNSLKDGIGDIYYKGNLRNDQFNYQSSSTPVMKEYHPPPSPVPDYSQSLTYSVISPITPIVPQRKRTKQPQTSFSHDKSTDKIHPIQIEEPPLLYCSPSVSSNKNAEKKSNVPKSKTSNIFGKSLRKLVEKMRSVSQERKKERSQSPSYQKGHIIDSNIEENHSKWNNNEEKAIQKYYLGEDPFTGGIYGKENKYECTNKTILKYNKRKNDDYRSQSTLGRLIKTNSSLKKNFTEYEGNSKTLPHHLHYKHDPPSKLENSKSNSNSTIHVSIINTVKPPAKPERTFKTNLNRSKSLNVHRLEDPSIDLKSPGLISNLSRSQRDLNEVSLFNSAEKRINLVNKSNFQKFKASPIIIEVKNYY